MLSEYVSAKVHSTFFCHLTLCLECKNNRKCEMEDPSDLTYSFVFSGDFSVFYLRNRFQNRLNWLSFILLVPISSVEEKEIGINGYGLMTSGTKTVLPYC